MMRLLLAQQSTNMKLYATTTSERASKGQGGNDYLKIILRDDKQQCFAYLTVKPDKTLFLDYVKDWTAHVSDCLEIRTNDDIKGNQKKGEHERNHIDKLHDEDCVYCRKDNGSL